MMFKLFTARLLFLITIQGRSKTRTKKERDKQNGDDDPPSLSVYCTQSYDNIDTKIKLTKY